MVSSAGGDANEGAGLQGIPKLLDFITKPTDVVPTHPAHQLERRVPSAASHTGLGKIAREGLAGPPSPTVEPAGSTTTVWSSGDSEAQRPVKPQEEHSPRRHSRLA